jgi:DNA-binding transcriptional LysR family regulator
MRMSLTAALRDLNKLNTFVRVAERRSFTRAAADLRTTPSVVSKHMKELEDALGFSLLTRSRMGSC